MHIILPFIIVTLFLLIAAFRASRTDRGPTQQTHCQSGGAAPINYVDYSGFDQDQILRNRSERWD